MCFYFHTFVHLFNFLFLHLLIYIFRLSFRFLFFFFFWQAYDSKISNFVFSCSGLPGLTLAQCVVQKWKRECLLSPQPHHSRQTCFISASAYMLLIFKMLNICKTKYDGLSYCYTSYSLGFVFIAHLPFWVPLLAHVWVTHPSSHPSSHPHSPQGSLLTSGHHRDARQSLWAK